LSQLFAAIDETFDGEFLAVVVGDDYSISRNSKSLPKHIAEVRFTIEDKRRLVQSLDFSEGSILVHCIKYGLPSLRDTIDKKIKTGAIRIHRNKVNRKISYEFVRTIEGFYNYFVLSEHHMHLQEIDFEVDNDIIRDYLRNGGFSVTIPERTHRIADSVAYANGHSWRINNVVEHCEDFQKEFHKMIIDKLL
jgi:hypothetical protein